MVGQTLKLHVKPVYGWGWFRESPNEAIDVPAAFDLDAEIAASSDGRLFKEAVGQVEEIEHPLNRMWVVLNPRHKPDDGDCNARVYGSRPRDALNELPEITGFAHVTRKE